MKRQVITIQEDMVIYAPHHGEVWMTVWEIAELLNVTGTAVKNTIKRIWKQSMLKDFQHSQYIKLENGYSAHIYDMEVNVWWRLTKYCHNMDIWDIRASDVALSASCFLKGL